MHIFMELSKIDSRGGIELNLHTAELLQNLHHIPLYSLPNPNAIC